MRGDLVIGIDSSTTATKAIAFDARRTSGRLAAAFDPDRALEILQGASKNLRLGIGAEDLAADVRLVESVRRVRDRFVAYWNPSLKVDGQGRATFDFVLPDNLTAWKVLVLAVTPDDRFGLGSGRLIATKDTELRSLLPNQVVDGDRFRAGFSVLNRASQPRTLAVTLEASGNMTPERLPRVAASGVDFVSAGALTHSAPALDISLNFIPTPDPAAPEEPS